jgi:hypothetical protein
MWRCPICKHDRDRRETTAARGRDIEVCSVCVDAMFWNVRDVQPAASLDAAVGLVDLLIDVKHEEIWRVTEQGRHRHGRPRKEVLDVLFVGLVAAMIGEGAAATLKRIDPTRVSGPLSFKTVTRWLAAPTFLPVLRLAYKGSIELVVDEEQSPAIAVDPDSEPDVLVEQLGAPVRGDGAQPQALPRVRHDP